MGARAIVAAALVGGAAIGLAWFGYGAWREARYGDLDLCASIHAEHLVRPGRYKGDCHIERDEDREEFAARVERYKLIARNAGP